jgi:phosphoserine phosphatase RsbU/P
MAKQPVRILLVEDDPDDVSVIRNLLGDRWDGPYELVHLELLSAALELSSRDTFDVILLDLFLPDSRGMETFFSMQNGAKEVPIVLLTKFHDETTAVKAVQAGAQDYLVKGQMDDNLLVRSIRYAIERNRRRRAEQALLESAEEFRAAQEIQQRLYPTRAPVLPGFDIAGALYPAAETAGDYFDYIPMLDQCMGIVLGDVSSHGMGPALLMSETRACLRTLAQMCSDVGEILTRANRVLAGDTNDFHFVTLAMARLDPKSRSLVYASAGQRVYILEPSGAVTVLDSTSLPLGINSDTTVPAAPAITLQSGQIVAFFTDGLVETESPGHIRFGVGRAMDVIRSERENSAYHIVEALREEAAEFSRHMSQLDDITVVIVKVK